MSGNPNSTNERKRYNGKTTKMVLAFDIGTTFSGATYAILRPGEFPDIQGVTRFPYQELIGGDTKVPSVLYYNARGNVAAAGAQTLDTDTIMTAKSEGWFKCEYFKLHLCPTRIPTNTNGLEIGKLPPRKSAEAVFGDFLKSMLEWTILYLESSRGDNLKWSTLKNDAQFILTHPNAWEGTQLQMMRRAAIQAGLIQDGHDERQRLVFVSEGEASLHWCLSSNLGPLQVKRGDAFIIADAGGGTIDINSYEIESMNPTKVQELSQPDCRFSGGIFVNKSAEAFFNRKLANTSYVPGVPSLLKEFESRTKRIFNNSQKPAWIQFGALNDDRSLGILGGSLKADGSEVANWFKLSIREAVDSVLAQQRGTNKNKMDVWLVGGFAGSQWLFNQLREELEPKGHHVYRPDANTSKAVADGAIAFYFDKAVTARVASLTSGVIYSIEYNPLDPDHFGRPQFTSPYHGRRMVRGLFLPFVKKGTRITETNVYTEAFLNWGDYDGRVGTGDLQITCYVGELPVPKWACDHPELFKPLCTVKADLARVCSPSNKRRGPRGAYYEFHFKVEVRFGLTEYEARLKWEQEGVQMSSPATVIFEEGFYVPSNPSWDI